MAEYSVYFVEGQKADISKLLEAMGEDMEDEVREMAEAASEIARPCSIFGAYPVSIDGDFCTVGNVRIHSRLMAENFAGHSRVFPYIISCGRELEEWSEQYADDPLSEYVADELKKLYLGVIGRANRDEIKRRFGIAQDAKLPSMNPGSIAAWPLSGQVELFGIFGGRDVVEREIGVHLTDSMLMLPSKSGSGIAFENESGYENCIMCPILDCPNRRAPYDPNVIMPV